METTKKISLPELPEGYYWKVGDMPAGQGGWVSHERVNGEWRVKPDPAVILMKRGTKFEHQSVPVWGKVWWSKKERIVRYQETLVEVQYDHVWRAMSLQSEELTVAYESDVPSFGEVYSKNLNADGSVKSVRYRLQLTDEGIVHVAEKIMVYLKRSLDREAYLEVEDSLRDKYYGEYPPKVLGEDIQKEEQ